MRATRPRTGLSDDAAGSDLPWVVERALAGEQAAAAELYRRFHPTVLAIQLANTDGDRQLAWDLTQDTFVKALHRLDQFEWRGPGSLRGWLATVARHVFLDHVRAAPQRRHGGNDVPDQRDPDESIDPDARVERDLDATRELTGRVLDRLKPEHRHVLRRLVGEGAKAGEVAGELGRSEAAVHQLRRRALDAARREVAVVRGDLTIEATPARGP